VKDRIDFICIFVPRAILVVFDVFYDACLDWVLVDVTDDRGRVPVRIDERPSFVYSLMY
jgi:hypothetical protein